MIDNEIPESKKYISLRRRKGSAHKTADIQSLFDVTNKDLTDELASAENTNKRLESTKNRLTEEVRREQRRADHLEEKLRAQEVQMKGIALKLEEQLKKQQFDSEHQIQDLSASLAAAKTKLKNLASSYDEANKQLSEYKKKNSDLNAEMKELRIKLQESSEGYGETKFGEKFKLQKGEVARLEDENRAYLRQIRELEDRVKEMSESVDALEALKAECSNLSNENSRLQKELSAAQREVAEMEETKASMKKVTAQLNQMKTDLKESQRKLYDLDDDKKKLERELSRLKSANREDVYAKASVPSVTGYRSDQSLYQRGSSSLETYQDSDARAGSEPSKDNLRSAYRIDRAANYQSDYLSSSSALSKSRNAMYRTKKYAGQAEQQRSFELSELKGQIESLEGKLKERQNLYESESKRREDLEKMLAQEQQNAKLSMDQAAERIELLTSQSQEMQDEIKRLQKAYQKKNREFDDLNIKHEEITFNLNQSRQSLSKLDLQFKQTNQLLRGTESKLKESENAMDKLRRELETTNEEFILTKQELESTKNSLSQLKKIFNATLKAFEEELYEVTCMKDKLQKSKAELENEVAGLLWYFKPLDTQVEVEEKKYHTLEFNFEEYLRNQINSELENLRSAQSVRRLSNKSIKELQGMLKESLAKLPSDMQEDVSFELEDLMNNLNKAQFKIKTKLFIFVALVENRVDPGIIREFANITLEFANGNLHIMHSPEALVKVSLKCSKSATEDTDASSNSFRDLLLNRLAWLRSKKTGKDAEDCKISILEGGEYDD